MRRTIWRVATAACVLLTAGGTWADTPTYKPPATWAVVSLLPQELGGIADLLSDALAKEEHLRLVSRDEIRQVMAERQLELADNSARRELGRILQADALMTLELAGQTSNWSIRVTIVHTRWGARLLVREVPCRFQGQAVLAGQLADLARQTAARFANGVRQVVAVPPFVSRSFLHDYDSLEVPYAKYLEAGLHGREGVAVVTGHEALAVKNELSLSLGDGVSRPALVMVDGEFEVAFAAADKPATVTFHIGQRIPPSAPRFLPDRTVALDQAQSYLEQEAASALLELVSATVTAAAKSTTTTVAGSSSGRPQAPPPPSPTPTSLPAQGPDSGYGAGSGGGVLTPTEQEFRALVERAYLSASKAAYVESTALRESALLLRDDADVRAALVDEYVRLLREGWNSIKYIGPEPTPRGARRREEYWQAALRHLDFLIRNRQVTAVRAIQLTQSVLQVVDLVYIMPGLEFGPLEQSRRRFLRDVYPLLLELPDEYPDPIVKNVLWYESLFACLKGSTWIDPREGFGSFAPRRRLVDEEMDLFVDVLTRILPPGFSPLRKGQYLLVFYVHASREEAFPTEAFHRMLSRLKASDRPITRALGELTELEYRLQHTPNEQWDVPGVLRQLDDLEIRCNAALAAGCNLPYREHRKFHQDLDLEGLRQKLQPSTQPATQPAEAPTPPPDPGAVRISELPAMEIRMLDGTTSQLSTPRQSGWGVESWMQCDDRTDLVSAHRENVTSLLVMRSAGRLEQIATCEPRWPHQIVWDGRHAWLCDRHGQVLAVSLERGLIATIGAQQGLPPGAAVVHPLAPGRVLAAGVFGPAGRGWCAEIVLEGSTPQVDVFLKAARPRPPVPLPIDADEHVDQVFGGMEHLVHLSARPGKGTTLLLSLAPVPVKRADGADDFVERQLEIDPQTRELAVRHYRLSLGVPYEVTPQWVFSVGGDKLMAEANPPDDQSPVQVASLGQDQFQNFGHRMWFHGNHVYAKGRAWVRIDPQTLQVELLSEGPLSCLKWASASAHYGVVARPHLNNPSLESLVQIQIVPTGEFPRPVDSEGRPIRP